MYQLNVSLQHSIATLAANGWSARKIARELNIHRETVGRYLRPEPISKPAIPPAGSAEETDSKPAILPAGSPEDLDSKPAIVQGLKALPKQSGEYLLEVVMRRYENRSTIMTSNRPLEDWGKLLSDVPTAGAILDQFLHHAITFAITGRSYRVKDSLPPPSEPKQQKPKKPNEPRPPGPRAKARQPAPARFTSLPDAS